MLFYHIKSTVTSEVTLNFRTRKKKKKTYSREMSAPFHVTNPLVAVERPCYCHDRKKNIYYALNCWWWGSSLFSITFCSFHMRRNARLPKRQNKGSIVPEANARLYAKMPLESGFRRRFRDMQAKHVLRR